MFDLLIKNGMVVDGTGLPWFHADIGIEKGKITEIGRINSSADKIIDASKKLVSPGFIDIHSHSDYSIIRYPLGESKVMQGVTMEVNGNCGTSPAPLFKSEIGRDAVQSEWFSFKDYFSKLEEIGISLNVVQLAGHTTVRNYVTKGEAPRFLTDTELTHLKNEIAKAIKEGCFGISSGLEFGFLRTLENMDEMVEACKVVAEYDAYYATHQRERDIWYEKATEEAIETARLSGLNSVHLSHFSVRYPAEGKSPVLMWMVDEARKKGIDVTCDVITPNYWDGYHWALEWLQTKIVPDTVLKSPIDQALKLMKDPKMQKIFRNEHEPDWKLFGIPANGRFHKEYPEGLKPQWHRVKINETKASPELIGKTIEEIAQEQGKDPWDVALSILIKEGEQAGSFQVSIVGSSTADWDSAFVLQHPTACVCTDRSINMRCANAYGAFPRVFRMYVRNRHLMPFEEAVMKMTSMPARIIKLKDRGVLKDGAWADVVVFDPERVADTATIEEPKKYPVGIDYVIVNGEVVAEKGKHTGKRPGKVLRKLD